MKNIIDFIFMLIKLSFYLIYLIVVLLFLLLILSSSKIINGHLCVICIFITLFIMYYFDKNRFNKKLLYNNN
jgi:hypothetical protein